jgi:hypothetical protein
LQKNTQFTGSRRMSAPAVAFISENAGNYLQQEPKLPTPQLEPEKVASAILDAAVSPARDVKVGAMSHVNTAIAKIAPRLGDMMAKMLIGRQQRDEPPHSREGALFQGSESGRTHGRGNENAADMKEAKESNVRPG